MATADAQALLTEGQDLYVAVAAVGNEVGRLIGDRVLAAQFFLNGGKCVRHFGNLERNVGAPAGRIGNAFQDFISVMTCAAQIGADGVHDHFGALRHFDGFFARHVALVIFSVSKQNDRAAHRTYVLGLQQFIAAGKIKRIVHCGTAAGTQRAHSDGKQFGVVGEILRDFGRDVETHHKTFVIFSTYGLIQKFDRCLLLEFKPVAYGIAGVNEQAYFKREIRLSTETADFRRRFIVVDHLEIIFLQIPHIMAVSVGHCENYVHFVYGVANGGERVVLRLAGRRGRGGSCLYADSVVPEFRQTWKMPEAEPSEEPARGAAQGLLSAPDFAAAKLKALKAAQSHPVPAGQGCL